MQPVEAPLFTHLLAEKWAKKAQTPKPTALNTMLRYSGAYGCGRRMGYDWFEANYTEPPTPGSIWQALVGTLIGEAQAEAMIEVYGGFAELPSKVNEWISGSADWFSTTTPLGPVVYEHKMKSSYAFNKAMGYKRAYGKASRTDPAGAPKDAVAQVAMNALGIERTHGYEIEWVTVGIVSNEVVSVMENAQINVSDYSRFLGEWHLNREVWEPIALREIDRLGEFAETMDLGYIPDRIALDDNSERVFLSPGGAKPPWQCRYCPFVSLCKSDGEGQVRVLDSKLVRREKEAA